MVWKALFTQSTLLLTSNVIVILDPNIQEGAGIDQISFEGKLHFYISKPNQQKIRQFTRRMVRQDYALLYDDVI